MSKYNKVNRKTDAVQVLIKFKGGQVLQSCKNNE